MRTHPAGVPLLDSFHIYDTTLCDGAQQEGISYSVTEKLAVAGLLDFLGVGFIEGGWPGALPRDTEFFRRAAAGELTLRHAALAAFGSTRKAGTRAGRDPQVRALLDSEAPVVTLVAKADRRHTERALRTDPAENRAMIADTVRLLVAEGRRIFLDAEHFFDGYHHDPDTALGVLDAAAEAGADVLVLCDTNGGNLPLRLAETVETVETVRARTGLRLGIHCQDDTGCAVANTVAAVAAGVTHVQCTANGYGERAGNHGLFAVIGNLVTKLDLPVLPEGRLGALVGAAEAIAALADGAELGLDLGADPDALTRSIARVKELEAAGWSFEATVRLRVGAERAEATASGEGPVRALEAALRRALAPHLPWLDTWTLSSYQIRVLGEGSRARVLAVSHDGEREWTTVGAHASVIEAAALALADAVAFQATRLARGG